jgi:hypothetical protein
VDPQILWASLDVLGPNDVQEKKKKKRKKGGERRIGFSSLPSYFSSFNDGLSIPSVTVPASCVLRESRNYSLIRIKKRRYHPVG